MPTVLCYCPGEKPGVVGSLQNYYTIRHNPLGLRTPNGKPALANVRAKTLCYTLKISNSNTSPYSLSIIPCHLIPKSNRIRWLKNIRATVSSFAEGEEEKSKLDGQFQARVIGEIDENPHLGIENDKTLDGQFQARVFGELDENPHLGIENDKTVLVPGHNTTNGGLGGIAEVLNISARSACGIVAGVTLFVLIFPVFMKPVMMANLLKFKVLSYITLLCGFYMAWNIGANDVANAMGTSVGSGALTLRQAVLAAAVLEFSGAFLVGSHVTHTMQTGILTPGTFNGRNALQFSGLLSSLAAAGTWLQVASYYGLPVSTTHCIIGAMVGFGLVYGGVGVVNWSSLARVVSSWVISPMIGAAVSFVVYKCIRRFVYSAPSPGQAAAKAAPIAVFVGVTALLLACFPNDWSLLLSFSAAVASGALGALLMHLTIHRQLGDLLGEYCEIPAAENLTEKHQGPLNFLMRVAGPSGTQQLRLVYSVFGYLQVLSAFFMSFAHGANDVANAIGPITSALAILQGPSLRGELVLPVDILAWGGFGIVAGLLFWGYRVIATIGKKITELTPTRGFAAEFAAATVVVMASKFGLPVSATHTLVGAVMGVGFARGLKSVHGETMTEIVVSWVVTIPVGALLSVIYTFIMSRFLPALW